MRMMDRCTHLSAAALEHQDVADFGPLEERSGPLAPQLHDLENLRDPQRAERSVVDR